MADDLQTAIQALSKAIRALPGTDESLQQMAARGIDRGKYDRTLLIREELTKVLDFLEPFVGDAGAEVFARMPRPLMDLLISDIAKLKEIVDSILVKCRRQPPPPSEVLPTFEGSEAGVARGVENIFSRIYSQLAHLRRDPGASLIREKNLPADAPPAPAPFVQDATPMVTGVVSGLEGNRRPVVITLHGVRTRGKWQKDLDEYLSDALFISKSLDYDWFGVLPFFFERQREKRVRWFVEEYQKIILKYPDTPSIIAHSFGTYIVARAIRAYAPLIKFDKVIFCGSIVPVDFPWSRVIEEGLANEVLNDYGHLDAWAGKAGLALPDAGPSGRKGFTDLAKGKVIQRHHPEWGHSHYFFDLNYKKRWIPFLKGENVRDVSLKPHWHFPLIRLVIIIAVALLAGYYIYEKLHLR
jgi:hypothetical protein